MLSFDPTDVRLARAAEKKATIINQFTIRDSYTDELIRWGFVEDEKIEELVELYAMSHGSEVQVGTIVCL